MLDEPGMSRGRLLEIRLEVLHDHPRGGLTKSDTCVERSDARINVADGVNAIDGALTTKAVIECDESPFAFVQVRDPLFGQVE